MSDTTAYRWHVGSNVPGCSAENAPACCESPIEARGVLMTELAGARDALPECDHDTVLTDGSCEPCALFLAACEVINNVPAGVNMAEGYSVAVNIGRALPIHHWITRWPASAFANHTTCRDN